MAILPYFADAVTKIPENDQSAFIIRRYSAELQDRLREWADRVRNSPSVRRSKTSEERRMLRHSHTVHSDEETMLGSVDDNHKEVAEWLRVNLTPSLCQKEYFDDCLPRDAVPLETVEDAQFREYVETIKNLNATERAKLLRRLLQMDVNGISHGADVSGFAIDLLSFLSAISHGYGLHGYAANLLQYKIMELQSFRNPGSINEDIDCDIVRGLLHRSIEGYPIPILRLDDAGHRRMHGIDTETMRKLGRHLLSLQSFIPLDCNGRVIDGEYEYPDEEND